MIHAPFGEGGGFVTRRPKSGHEEFLGEIKLSSGSGSSISNLGGAISGHRGIAFGPWSRNNNLFIWGDINPTSGLRKTEHLDPCFARSNRVGVGLLAESVMESGGPVSVPVGAGDGPCVGGPVSVPVGAGTGWEWDWWPSRCRSVLESGG